MSVLSRQLSILLLVLLLFLPRKGLKVETYLYALRLVPKKNNLGTLENSWKMHFGEMSFQAMLQRTIRNLKGFCKVEVKRIKLLNFSLVIFNALNSIFKSRKQLN